MLPMQGTWVSSLVGELRSHMLCSDLLVARVSPSTMPLLQEPFCSFTTCEGAAWAGLVSSRWCGGGSGAIPPRRWGSCPPSPGSGGRPELYSSRVSETPLLAPTLAFLFEGIAANRWDLLCCCCCCCVFFGHTKACGILVLQPGIKPMPPVLEAWSLNHWTTREVPGSVCYGDLFMK